MSHAFKKSIYCEAWIWIMPFFGFVLVNEWNLTHLFAGGRIQIDSKHFEFIEIISCVASIK